MKKIKDKSVDLVVTDLPYKQTSHSWDCELDLPILWVEYKRILKDKGIVVLTAKGQFMIDLILSNNEWFRYEWVWDKNKGANFAHVRYRPLNVHEYILIFYNPVGGRETTYNPQMVDGKEYNGIRSSNLIEGVADEMIRQTKKGGKKRYPKSIIRVDGIAQRNIVHPTQKPVALFEYIIKTYSNENELVLDNTSGSGTTSIACENTGRKWICIDKEKEFCDINIERLKKEVKIQ